MPIELKVDLGDRSYPIFIGRGALKNAAAAFENLALKKQSLAIVADSLVKNLHAEKISALEKFGKMILQEGKEGTKCFKQFEFLCDKFAELGLDRKSAIVAIGGGVIGDITGFAAASYMRGINFYQVPTTLLAMVDSSVGGKTGINICAGKNLVGAFHQPKAVFADIEFLDTLPPREFAAGMAEVIKCALLGDAEFFCELENLKEPLNPRHEFMAEAIRKSCALKARIVAADELETAASGGRALLNLGHTFGHAIEHCAGYGNYLHGEAVAIGILMAADLSVRIGSLKESDFIRVKKILEIYNLPTSLRTPFAASEMLAAMLKDKKASSGNLRFVLFDEIGNARTENVSENKIYDTLTRFNCC